MDDPERRLKEMLFEFVRAVERGEMDMTDRYYGGVLVSNDPPRVAYLRLEFEGLPPRPADPT